MSLRDKEKALWNWISNIKEINSLFFVGADLNNIDGQYVITPLRMIKDEPIKKYSRGVTMNDYVMNVAWFYPLVYLPNSENNLDNINEGLKRAWYAINEKIKANDFPDFEGIKSVSVSGADIAGFTDNAIKCQFQVIVRYYCKGV